MRRPVPAQGDDGEPIRRLTAWARGRVQGVGFRWWVRARALELGLVGWAANLDDGRVEVVVEGREGACRALLEALQGSDAASS
ncbi:MAG: acylphosphatase, partial [Actinomycetota bacterium]|nr:acylphosphatase [Actinomycetota bacterium]